MATPHKLIQVADDSKKERWLQIGKHRHRIANDHDEFLDQVMRLFRYRTKEDALFATSYYGAMLMGLLGFVPVKNVDFRAVKKGGM